MASIVCTTVEALLRTLDDLAEHVVGSSSRHMTGKILVVPKGYVSGVGDAKKAEMNHVLRVG